MTEEEKREDEVVHGRILPSHIMYQDRVLISKLIKDSYRDGFLNGMAIRKDDDYRPIKKLTNTK